MGAQAVRLSNVDIDNALKNKDFEVLFQPIFDLGNGALARMEAFVRWRHPGLGVLPPGAFISFFESQGRMSELTRYVLGRALYHYLKWRGPYAPGISINLALSDLGDDAFASHLTVLLREHDFPADLITLECPMPPVTTSLDASAENFKRLSSTGARLAIEVRGRANELLRELKPFPFDEIKTGGAAILRFARTVRGPGLSAISELLDIANRANAAITAVGVEDQASLAALRGLGFTAAQGNHLGKVGPLKDFMPSRVNEVRALLELDPLSADDLASLFRTGAPTPTPAKKAAQKRRALPPPSQQASTKSSPRKPAAKAPAAGAKPDRARKEAAIARARKKAAASSGRRPIRKNAKEAAAIKLADASRAESSSKQPPAARKLQERLSEAFPGEEPKSHESGAAKPPPAAPASKPPAKKAAAPADAKSEKQPATESGELFDAPIDHSATAKNTKTAPPAPDQASKEKPAPDRAAGDDAHQAAGSTAQTAKTAQTAPAQSEKTEPAKPVVEDEKAAVEQAVAKADEDAFESASLAVGRAGAHFRPVMHVGGPPVTPPSAPSRRSPPPEPNPDIVEVFLDDEPGAPAPQPDPHPEPFHDSLVGDLDAEDVIFEDYEAGPAEKTEKEFSGANEPRAPVRRRRPRRNLLTRKYRIWPTHFWPRSWKRAWRRRKARLAQRAAAEE